MVGKRPGQIKVPRLDAYRPKAIPVIDLFAGPGGAMRGLLVADRPLGRQEVLCQGVHREGYCGAPDASPAGSLSILPQGQGAR